MQTKGNFKQYLQQTHVSNKFTFDKELQSVSSSDEPTCIVVLVTTFYVSRGLYKTRVFKNAIFGFCMEHFIFCLVYAILKC